ncbi:DUF6314 family protein [Palleronia abyssalis]|uniref:DUF6314 domain-containing protein n=1 Tax=Palleronia abyssalis TaxID=1501240 RepID=A0A2R8C1N3_9RHOB|nr:DUF6314 family protein [Palleronia abyssalis]SPJ26226.1 hypothetical protein PAA8504_04083 [Palleronia abyssalis]
MGLGLADFAGVWAIRRTIDDRRQDQVGRFEGEGRFTVEGATLHYRETGLLKIGDATLEAEQSHVWRSDGTLIRVCFSDGRPFHSFETGVLHPAAQHLCAPDTYDVAYDFGGWPEWRSEWTVTGPRKDYTLVSTYARHPGFADQAA